MVQGSRLQGSMRSCSKVQSAAGFFGFSGVGKAGCHCHHVVVVLIGGKYLQMLKIEGKATFVL